MDLDTKFLKALNKLQGTLVPIKKDATNPHFNSQYATLEAVNAAVMGPLSEAGFILTQGGVDIGGKVYLRTTLSHVDGGSLHYDYPLIADSNPQHLAAAVSYARRYAICAILNLSVEDDDGNSAVSRPTPSATVMQVFGSNADTMAKFIPQAIDSRPIQKKDGTTIMAYTIVSPDGHKYGTLNEQAADIASAALQKKREIAFTVKKNGAYLNAVNVRMVNEEDHIGDAQETF